jgi:hypothetical protein
MKQLFFLFSYCFFITASSLVAQDNSYTLEQLLQSKVSITAHPAGTGVTYVKDTVFTLYQGGSVELKTYTLEGEQWDDILNPAPSGLVLNGQYFSFYCDVERSLKKPLRFHEIIYEFSYLNHKYLVFTNIREDCLTKGCRFRCYNVFDITNPKAIIPYSFESIFEGSESFGDYNYDGKIDVVRIGTKAPESYIENEKDDKKANILITAYTLDNGKPLQIRHPREGNSKGGAPRYIYAKPKDENISGFTPIQADWFVSFKDEKSEELKAKTYYPDYISFDPKNDFLYDTAGYRVDKKSWVIHLEDFDEKEGAKSFCDDLAEAGFGEAYIQIDQYNRMIVFQILYGNYENKEQLEKIKNRLIKEQAIYGEVKNLRTDF